MITDSIDLASTAEARGFELRPWFHYMKSVSASNLMLGLAQVPVKKVFEVRGFASPGGPDPSEHSPPIQNGTSASASFTTNNLAKANDLTSESISRLEGYSLTSGWQDGIHAA
jgi:hypothetical protein